MQVCISLQTDNHASTRPLGFYRLYAFPAAQPSVKALKAQVRRNKQDEKQFVTQQLYELPWTVAGLLGHCSKGDSESEFF